MKNEIKEILDKLNKLEYDDIHLIICEVISRREIKNLLDYITNLQKELQEANESITWWSNRFNAVERNKKDYKSRIDKATEYIKDSGITFLNLANQRCFCNNNCADKIINILNDGDE